VKTLLYIRRIQFHNFFIRACFNKKLGLITLVIGVLAVLLFSLFQAVYVFYSVPILFCLFLQIIRKDYALLKKTDIALHTIYSFEYLILSIPFFLAAILQQRFGYIIFLIVFLFLLPIVNPKSKKIL
jgi:hypothetical protein